MSSIKVQESRIVCDLDEEKELPLPLLTQDTWPISVYEDDGSRCSVTSAAHSIISLASDASTITEPDEDPLKIDIDVEKDNEVKSSFDLPARSGSPDVDELAVVSFYNAKFGPVKFESDVKKRNLIKYGLMEDPEKVPKPKPVKRTTRIATGKPVIRLPTKRLQAKEKPEISSNWVSSSSSSNSNNSDVVSSSSTIDLETPSPSSRASTSSLDMLQCQVRVRRLNDNEISYNEHNSRMRAPKRRGSSPNSGISVDPDTSLFPDEHIPVGRPKKKPQQKVVEKQARNTYSRYGRLVSVPRTYNENSENSRSPKSSAKAGQSESSSNGHSVRRALFDSSKGDRTIDLSDGSADDSIRAPSPFRYNSSSFMADCSFSACDFDKENYLERYITPGPAYAEISTHMLKFVRAHLNTPKGTKLLTKYHLTFKQEHLVRYESTKWLDDPNIDFYLEMIRDRNRNTPGLPRVYVFHCFFYKLFSKSGYDAIQDASVRDAICDNMDLIFFPVIIRDHWRLVVADFRDQTLKCYDSMFRVNDKSLQNIKEYLIRVFREYREKHKSGGQMSMQSTTVELSPPVSDSETPDEFSSGDPALHGALPTPEPELFENWTLDCVSPDDIPQQKNGSDCGIFLCQYAESLARDVKTPFDFNQKNMPYFRARMAYESLTGNLLPAPLPMTAINPPASAAGTSPPAEGGDS